MVRKKAMADFNFTINSLTKKIKELQDDIKKNSAPVDRKISIF